MFCFCFCFWNGFPIGCENRFCIYLNWEVWESRWKRGRREPFVGCWIRWENTSSGVKVDLTGKMPLDRIYDVCASDSARCCCAGGVGRFCWWMINIQRPQSCFFFSFFLSFGVFGSIFRKARLYRAFFTVYCIWVCVCVCVCACFVYCDGHTTYDYGFA